MKTKTPSSAAPPNSGYAGQYLVPGAARADGSTPWYFKPKPSLTPDLWIERYGKTVRVPRDPARRVGGDLEYHHAYIDAAGLFAEFNRMRGAPEAGGEWPHGSLRWIVAQWRSSPWFQDELADDTRRGYESCLKQIEAWADRTAERQNGHPHMRRLTTKGVGAFLAEFDDRPTRQRHLKSVLSSLFTHAIQLGAVESNPVAPVRLRRRKKGEARTRQLWDQAFVTGFIETAQRMDVPEVAAWVQTMWDIGRRPGDLHGLMVLDDLTRRRLDRGEIRSGLYYDPRAQAVRGWQQKTGSFGSIGLDPLTVELIEAVRPRVEDGSNHRHVFIDSRFCEPFTFERFNPQFRLVIRAMDEDVALTKTTPQSGRHSCIMRFRRAGHSHADIQEVTGHYDEKTIARFYVVEDDSRVDALKAARAASEGNGD